MKIEQLSPHVYRLGSFFLIPFTVWVVVEDDGVVLIDTGMSFMVKNILRFIDGLGKGPLKYILLTHGHVDHVGGIKKILQNRKVPVYIHHIEAPFMEGSAAYPGRKPKVMLPAGIAAKMNLYEDGLIDLPASDKPAPTETSPGKTRSSLRGYLTPGHAPGHVAYHHVQDNVLLAGDLFWSKNGKLLLPKFSYDNALAVQSSEIVDRLQPKIVDCCHGWPVENPGEQMAAYREESNDR